MIAILQSPAADRIILDGNSTPIKIQSTNGEGHYFRVFIFIDGQFFDVQHWSRIDAYTAVKDLKNLYKAYFKPDYTALITSTISMQTHLKKYVGIYVEERNIQTDAITGSTIIPGFYIIYNNKAVQFQDTAHLAFLDVPAAVMPVTNAGLIELPFYANTNNQVKTVKIEIISDAGTTLATDTRENVNGKNMFMYRKSLTNLGGLFNIGGLGYGTLWVTVKITLGTGVFAPVLQKNFRVIRNPDYKVKRVLFMNNFGYYINAYFDGETEITNSLNPATYEDYNGNDITYEVDEQSTIVINTGSMLSDERALIDQVTTSIDTRLQLDTNGNTGRGLLTAATLTKKVTRYKDRQHQYSEPLIFTVKPDTNIINSGLIVSAGIPNLVITEVGRGDTIVQGNQIFIDFNIFFQKNNGYNPAALTLQFKNTVNGAWTNVQGSAQSPRGVRLPGNNYYFRLIDPANSQTFSNEYHVQ